ncbi:MAG TPA: hypothetical protein VGG37_00465 [Opitutaceae bacterium]|jgi:hypothetical protein
MLIAALVIFAVAAVIGLTLAVKILKKKETSKPVALLHGLAGAAGLVILILQAVKHPATLLTASIVLLVIAALGGVVLFANDLRKKPGPAALVIIHALAAVAAVVLVLIVATS